MDLPPTPPPTPTPTVESIKIFNFNNEIKQDFTIHLGDAPVTLTATAYPVEQFTDAKFTWETSDDTLLKLSVSEDTKTCTCEILGTRNGGVSLTAKCNGAEYKLIVYLIN